MKWEIDPSVLLKVSGTASLLFGLSAATSPKNFHDTYSTSNVAFSEPAIRYGGIVGTWLGSEQLVLSARDNKEAQKDMLKVAGFGWLAVAATHAYNAQNDTQLRDISNATALGQAVLGGLCLWKGYEDNDSDSV
ncbi:hypothetical protein D9Q98_009275 [Chlorella vulgaris]|uniref:Uncharacterized protein n=1 Tax=Chlorella vulgaris TaxID=3077 RepID=A0A9D4TPG6_CHLVU|nr:hypothetical protein D9Q98_009275 [Chlorella vulgaris]